MNDLKTKNDAIIRNDNILSIQTGLSGIPYQIDNSANHNSFYQHCMGCCVLRNTAFGQTDNYVSVPDLPNITNWRIFIFNAWKPIWSNGVSIFIYSYNIWRSFFLSLSIKNQNQSAHFGRGRGVHVCIDFMFIWEWGKDQIGQILIDLKPSFKTYKTDSLKWIIHVCWYGSLYMLFLIRNLLVMNISLIVRMRI